MCSLSVYTPGFFLPSTLSVGLCICLSAGLSAYIHHYIFDVFSACSFVCLSVGKSSCLLAIRQSDCQSFCSYVKLSFCQSVGRLICQLGEM